MPQKRFPELPRLLVSMAPADVLTGSLALLPMWLPRGLPVGARVWPVVLKLWMPMPLQTPCWAPLAMPASRQLVAWLQALARQSGQVPLGVLKVLVREVQTAVLSEQGALHQTW